MKIKKSLIVFVLISNLFNSYSQFNEEKIILDTRYYARGIVLIDFDNDFDTDIFSIINYNRLNWFVNLGEGIFSKRMTLDISPYNMSCIGATDIDGDGFTDVLLGQWSDVGGSIIGWLKNNGDGTFESLVEISTENFHVKKIIGADLDNDGDQDIVFIDLHEDKIAWYENFGGGLFSGENIISITSNTPQDIISVDLDLDGDLDLVCASSTDNKVAWYKNDGFGIFSDEIIISIDAELVVAVNFEDLDNDGDYDIVSASKNDNKIAWYENLGDGLFGMENILSTTAHLANFVYCKDLNADGLIDIISGSSGDDKIAWYKNLDGTSFDSESIISISPDTSDYLSIIICDDLNGDSSADVISLYGDNDNRRNLTWYQNDGEGNFLLEHPISGPFIENGRSLDIVDLDSDGYEDILIASQLDNKISWYRNLYGEGSVFDDQRIIFDSLIHVTYARSIDVDMDGYPDVVATCTGGYGYLDPKIVWFKNEGGVTFSAFETIDTTHAEIIESADIDGDDYPDLICIHLGGHEVVWYKNMGDNTFGAKEIIYVETDNIADMVLLDYDLDGDVDILECIKSDGQLVLLRNSGEGVFDIEILIEELPNNIRSIKLGDADNDGDMDFFTISVSPDKVYWFENLGLDAFSEKKHLTSDLSSARDIFLSDIDLDNDLDVLTAANNSPNNISWYENIDGVNFGPQINLQSTKTAIGSRKVAAFDADLDGDNDVITLNFGNGKISIHENETFGLYQVRGKIYVDENENGIWEHTEHSLELFKITSSPYSNFAFTYPDGRYFLNFDEEIFISYSVFPEDLADWYITSTPAEYEVTIDGDFISLEDADFGLFPSILRDSITVDIAGGFPRCNSMINYWVNIKNKGTTKPSGKAHVKLDDQFNFISSTPSPSLVDGKDIYWDFDSLYYFENKIINLIVETPGEVAFGEDLISSVSVDIIDFEEVIFSVNDSIVQNIVCAYDPNDKQVNPKGFDSLGYVSPSTDALEYMIRFQNTGTDTAVNVVILDKLDLNLDWSSLEIISSSHPFNLDVNYTGMLKFEFKKIFLPDSNVNFISSQGYIKYKLKLKPELSIGESIYNEAKILFDYNSPIITNTVVSTLWCVDSVKISLPLEKDSLVCNQESDFSLNGSPEGGEFSGSGLFDNLFSPESAGFGFHLIYYNKLDEYGCNYSDSIIINVIDCLGIKESSTNSIKSYPNPFNEFTVVYFEQSVNTPHILIINDVLGKEVYKNENITGDSIIIEKKLLGMGIFFLTLLDQEMKQVGAIKLVIV